MDLASVWSGCLAWLTTTWSGISDLAPEQYQPYLHDESLRAPALLLVAGLIFWVVAGRLFQKPGPQSKGQTPDEVKRPTNVSIFRRWWWCIRPPFDLMQVDGLAIDRTRKPHCAWLGPTGGGKSASVATVRVNGQRPTLIVTPDLSDPLFAAGARLKRFFHWRVGGDIAINVLIGEPTQVAEMLTEVFRSGGVGAWKRAARRATTGVIRGLDESGTPRSLQAIGEGLAVAVKGDRELKASCAMWVERFLDLAEQFGPSIGPDGVDIANLLRAGYTVMLDNDAFEHPALTEDIVALGLAEARRCAALVPKGFRLIFEEAGQLGERIELAYPFFRAGRRRRVTVDVLTQAESDLRFHGNDAITNNLATRVYFAQEEAPLQKTAADRLDLKPSDLSPARMRDFTAWVAHGKIRRLIHFPKPPSIPPTYSPKPIPTEFTPAYPEARRNRVEIVELWQPPEASDWPALPPPSIEEQEILAQFEKTSTCWVWTGKKDKDGYGYATYRGKRAGTHTIMYRLAYGEDSIPKGKELDHYACNNRPCGRPEHLEVVSHAENMRRMHARRGHKVKAKVEAA